MFPLPCNSFLFSFFAQILFLNYLEHIKILSLASFFNLSIHFIPADASTLSVETAKREVLGALSQIIDPDFGTDIVSCGFVKDLEINGTLEEVIELKLFFRNKEFCINLKNYCELSLNNALLEFQVSFRLELTTPACPIKDMVLTNKL